MHFVFDHIVISLIIAGALKRSFLSTMYYLDIAPPLLMTMKVLLSA